MPMSHGAMQSPDPAFSIYNTQLGVWVISLCVWVMRGMSFTNPEIRWSALLWCDWPSKAQPGCRSHLCYSPSTAQVGSKCDCALSPSNQPGLLMTQFYLIVLSHFYSLVRHYAGKASFVGVLCSWVFRDDWFILQQMKSVLFSSKIDETPNRDAFILCA